MKYLRKYTQDDLAEKYAVGTVRRTFGHWLDWGRRLLMLCSGGKSQCSFSIVAHLYSAGTMYILPIIAALGMRTKITGETSSPEDIVSLANALREVKRKCIDCIFYCLPECSCKTVNGFQWSVA
jgi:hypothetical protein